MKNYTLVTFIYLMIANPLNRHYFSLHDLGQDLTFYPKKLIFVLIFVRTIHFHLSTILTMTFYSLYKAGFCFLHQLKCLLKIKPQNLALSMVGLLVLPVHNNCWAWGQHSNASYRALENLPEISTADLVEVQSLDSFLKVQEHNIQKLLQKQEIWAQENIKNYPRLPPNLRFIAGNFRNDAQRRQSFISALRIAADTRFALYVQTDPRLPNPTELSPLATENVISPSLHKWVQGGYFYQLKPGQKLTALSILATATDEPDWGFDMMLWEDSPSSWGKIYGMGTQPFSTVSGPLASQSPFHSGFYFEQRLVNVANPRLSESYPLLRIHQFSTLAELAFTNGHDYWGWRFLGNGLHYLQDLTQPYHASVTPGETTAYLAGLHLLDSLGMSQRKNELFLKNSNRNLMLDRYQTQMLQKQSNKRYDSIAEVALKNTMLEDRLPKWNYQYPKNVVAKEAFLFSEKLAETLSQTLPEKLLNDPYFDFSQQRADFDLMTLVAQSGAEKQLELEGTIARLLEQFGIHSRQMVKAILMQSLPNINNNSTELVMSAPSSGQGLVQKTLKKDWLKLNAN